MKKISALHAMIFGIGIGMPITLTCMILLGGFGPAVKEFLTWTVASALYGLVSLLVFRKSDRLGMPAALGVHCLACAGITVAAILLCGYVKHLQQIFRYIVPVFLVVYALVFCAIFFSIKREERKINEALEKK